MPARLIALHPVQGAPHTVLGECWIESDITRIGSAPDADLRIERGEPQIATVHFRDGHYMVYRRSHHPLVLGGRPLPRNEPVPWPPGLILGITGSILLVLTVDANPDPAPRPVVVLADAAGTGAAGDRHGWNRRIRMLLLALPIMTVAFLLGRGPSVPLRPSNEFSALQAKLDAAEPHHPRVTLWRQRLQEARLQELGNRPGIAHQTLTKLRDSLLEARHLANPPLSAIEQEVLRFGSQELERLRTHRTSW